MVKIHANTAVFSLTASSPNTQVNPSSGKRITVALTVLLYVKRIILVSVIFGAHVISLLLTLQQQAADYFPFFHLLSIC